MFIMAYLLDKPCQFQPVTKEKYLLFKRAASRNITSTTQKFFSLRPKGKHVEGKITTMYKRDQIVRKSIILYYNIFKTVRAFSLVDRRV